MEAVTMHSGCFIYIQQKKKQLSYQITASFSTWCHQESNRGHKDFQSFALKPLKSLAKGSSFQGNQLSYCSKEDTYLCCFFFVIFVGLLLGLTSK